MTLKQEINKLTWKKEKKIGLVGWTVETFDIICSAGWIANTTYDIDR
jgi:hypothetical protein